MSDLDKLLDDRIRAAVARAIADVRAEIVEHITVTEYARRWSISQSTVREALAEKRLEHTHVGRAVRIPASARILKRSGISATDRARLTLLGGGRK